MIRSPMKTALAALVLSASAALAQAQQPGEHFILNWDLDADDQVTLEEAATKRGDVFTMFDADENDRLDAEEYAIFDETRAADMEANAGDHGRGQMKNAEAGLRREANDADGDGIVTRDEFIGGAEAWFARMDRNGDGVITTADFGPRRNG